MVTGLIALAVAYMLTAGIAKSSAGNARMQEISGYIHEGAMAFLYREYKYLAVFIVVVAVLISAFLHVSTAVCFVSGAIFSILTGYFGMIAATKANVRTAEAARGGIAPALKIAFSGGAVMGLGVVGLGEVSKEAYPDWTQFEPKSEYFDPKATKETPRWFAPDISFREEFPRVVTLEEMKIDPKLKGLKILEVGNRLSIVPVSSEHFRRIVKRASG